MMHDGYHVKQIFRHLGLTKQMNQKGTMLVYPSVNSKDALISRMEMSWDIIEYQIPFI